MGLATLGVKSHKAAEAVNFTVKLGDALLVVRLVTYFFGSAECKLLPHLGNQLAFFVDKEK